MSDDLTQRGTPRKLQKPLAQQMADARLRAEARAKRRKAAFDALKKSIETTKK